MTDIDQHMGRIETHEMQQLQIRDLWEDIANEPYGEVIRLLDIQWKRMFNNCDDPVSLIYLLFEHCPSQNTDEEVKGFVIRSSLFFVFVFFHHTIGE